MALGLGLLRLPPAAFWSMTPRELAAAARPFVGDTTAPLDRPALTALAARFPDTPPRSDGQRT